MKTARGQINKVLGARVSPNDRISKLKVKLQELTKLHQSFSQQNHDTPSESLEKNLRM